MVITAEKTAKKKPEAKKTTKQQEAKRQAEQERKERAEFRKGLTEYYQRQERVYRDYEMLIEAEKELLEGEGIEALVEKRTGSKNSIFYDKELKYFKRTLRTRIEERKRSIADTKRDYLAEAPKADSFSHYRFRPRFRGNERNGEGIDDLDPDFQFIIDNHLDAEIFDKKITRDLGKTGLTEGLDYHIIKEEKHRTAAFKEIEHAVNFGMRYYNHYMSTHRR